MAELQIGDRVQTGMETIYFSDMTEEWNQSAINV